MPTDLKEILFTTISPSHIMCLLYKLKPKVLYNASTFLLHPSLRILRMPTVTRWSGREPGDCWAARRSRRRRLSRMKRPRRLKKVNCWSDGPNEHRGNSGLRTVSPSTFQAITSRLGRVSCGRRCTVRRASLSVEGRDLLQY